MSTPEEKNEEGGGEEEDWSHLMIGDGSSFSRHDTVVIELDETTRISINCTDALSPMDMMDLSFGRADATCHKIWMGAFLLINALPLLKEHFHENRILELGCGTGIAGIAVVKQCSPRTIHLTDLSKEALKLTATNCALNFPPQFLQERVQIHPLEWGSSSSSSSFGTTEIQDLVAHEQGCNHNERHPDKLIEFDFSFDTVMATDVLYDCDALPALLETTNIMLALGGIFVLSHVPRAALPDHVNNETTLEGYIIQEAMHHGLRLEKIHRPTDLMKIFDGDGGDEEETTLDMRQYNTQRQHALQEMDETGASIMIFVK
jgi:predicted nicotinamide N-methyase